MKPSSLQNRSHILLTCPQHAHNVHCNDQGPLMIPKVLLPRMQAHSLSQQAEKAWVPMSKFKTFLTQFLCKVWWWARALISVEQYIILSPAEEGCSSQFLQIFQWSLTFIIWSIKKSSTFVYLVYGTKQHHSTPYSSICGPGPSYHRSHPLEPLRLLRSHRWRTWESKLPPHPHMEVAVLTNYAIPQLLWSLQIKECICNGPGHDGLLVRNSYLFVSPKKAISAPNTQEPLHATPWAQTSAIPTEEVPYQISVQWKS